MSLARLVTDFVISDEYFIFVHSSSRKLSLSYHSILYIKPVFGLRSTVETIYIFLNKMGHF